MNLRAVSTIVAGMVIFSCLALVLACTLYIIERSTLTAVRVLHATAFLTNPTRMVLEPLNSTCSSGVMYVRLRVYGLSDPAYEAIVLTRSGEVLGIYHFKNGNATMLIPCSKDSIIVVKTVHGYLKPYSFDEDPTHPCLHGVFVRGDMLTQDQSYCIPGVADVKNKIENLTQQMNYIWSIISSLKAHSTSSLSTSVYLYNVTYRFTGTYYINGTRGKPYYAIDGNLSTSFMLYIFTSLTTCGGGFYVRASVHNPEELPILVYAKIGFAQVAGYPGNPNIPTSSITLEASNDGVHWTPLASREFGPSDCYPPDQYNIYSGDSCYLTLYGVTFNAKYVRIKLHTLFTARMDVYEIGVLPLPLNHGSNVTS